MRSSVRSRRANWLANGFAALGLLAACSVKTADVEEVTSSSAQALSSIPAEFASTPSVYVNWQTTNQLGTQAANGASLVAVLNNNTSAPITVALTLDATGLDQRNATVGFGNIAIPANGSTQFSFAPSQLPVQSVGTESQAKLRIETTASGSPTLRVTSAPLSYQFDPTYANVTFFGVEGEDFVQNVQPPSDLTNLTNPSFETGDSSGWTFTGATQSIATIPRSGKYSIMLGATTATNGDSSVSQTFTAVTGATSLGFWYKSVCPDTVQYDWATATLFDNTVGGSTTILAKTCTTNAWTQVTAAILAGHSYTLTLTNHDDNYAADPTYTLFDNVTVNPNQLNASVLTSAAATFTLQGRVWNGSSWTDDSQLPPIGSRSSLVQYGTYALRGPRAQRFLNDEVAVAPVSGSGTYNYTICAQFPGEFVDAGYGEDRIDTPKRQQIAAAYAHYATYPLGIATPASTGYLDANGCAFVALGAGDWQFSFSTFHQVAQTLNVRTLIKNSPNSGLNGLGFITSFHIGGPQVLAVTDLPNTEFPESRVAGVVSTILTGQDTLWSPVCEFCTVPTITIESTSPCGTNAGACYANGDPILENRHVLLGANNSGPDTNSFKNIIGHEFGHNVADILSGFPSTSQAKQPENNAWCKCDHIQATNQIHCLQSKQEFGFGNTEGWGHFYALNAFENHVSGSCVYTYTKDFKNINGTITPAPFAASCLNQKWMNTNCTDTAVSGMANEWDWADFYRDISTAPASQRSSLESINYVYKAGCTGSVTSKCTSANTLNFTSLKTGANIAYGPNDPRALYFAAQGATFGVDH